MAEILFLFFGAIFCAIGEIFLRCLGLFVAFAWEELMYLLSFVWQKDEPVHETRRDTRKELRRDKLGRINARREELRNKRKRLFEERREAKR